MGTDGYYPELDKLEEMRESDSWNNTDNAKYYEAYLLQKGQGYRDYDTGEFRYRPTEMGG